MNKDDQAMADTFENSYGDWLRLTLDKKKMSVPNLSDASGISPPAIYNIISGRSKNPQNKTREKIEKSIGEKYNRPKIEKSNEESVPGLGDLTDFDPHDESDLPDCPGVYVFYDITDRPIYVGRASTNGRTIRNRVKEHYEKFWFKRPLVNNGAYIEINEPKLCEAVEKALIKFLKSNAVLNKHYVDRAE